MKKLIKIEGMNCGHCKANVEKALTSIDGVEKVEVSLENKSAELLLVDTVTNDVLKNAIEDAGYDVITIE